MIHPLIRKLENYIQLAKIEHQALLDVIGPVQRFGPREEVVVEGEVSDGIILLLEGLVCRYKLLPDGRRQIIAYFVPGDMCDLRVFILRRMDNAITTLAPASVAILPRERVSELTEAYPRIARAMRWAALAEESIAREWLVSLGQRTAYERLAHFICEMFFRLRAVDLTDGMRCEIPLTQAELADTLGLSTVHVNRTLQDLRRAGLISLRGKDLTIHDLAALQRVAMFSPSYLHLGGDRDA